MFQNRLLILGGFLFATLLAIQPALARQQALEPIRPGAIERISAGTQPQGGGGSYAAISANGRQAVFESPASDLVPGHIADSWDVFVRDREQDVIQRASTKTGGQPVYNPGDYTSAPAISGSGRYVAFMSRAENLTGHAPNSLPDIYVHDRDTRVSELVSIGTDGQPGNGASFNPAISGDGRYVAFQSLSSNLVIGDENDAIDVFVRDRQLNVTELISVSDTGNQGVDPNEYGYSSVTISADGRFVGFNYQSLPAEIALSGGESIVYIRDRQSRATQTVSEGLYPALSGNGQTMALISAAALTPDDKNEDSDLYLFHRTSGVFERISSPGDPDAATGLFVSSPPSLSTDGQRLAISTRSAFVDSDDNEVADIYVLDRQDRSIVLISTNGNGDAGNDESFFPALAADGSTVAFVSLATNLVNGDENQRSDVFLVPLTAPSAGPIDLSFQVSLPFLMR